MFHFKELTMKRVAWGGLALGIVLLSGPPASLQGQVKFGETAADFPPGVFTDGGNYSLQSLRGKVVVLYFFEKQ